MKGISQNLIISYPVRIACQVFYITLILVIGSVNASIGAQDQTNKIQHSDPIADGHFAQYPESDYLMATGHGDLTQGTLGCERVSDTVARMELAKQIRVLVKEQAIDRIREQTGKSVEQDIEIVIEEFTSELLQDAKIVNRTVDKASGTCYSTAVMPKIRITPESISNFENSPAGQ